MRRVIGAECRYLGSTEATRRPRDERYRTTPGTRAKSESSPPFPTPGPGWILVPRWRTMMEPAFTS